MPKVARATVPHKPNEGKVRKKRRVHPGTKALREIKRYQTSTALLLQGAPLKMAIREICNRVTDERAAEEVADQETFAWQPSALNALQVALEDKLADVYKHAMNNTVHAKRQELMLPDWKLYLSTRSLNDPLVRQNFVKKKKVVDE